MHPDGVQHLTPPLWRTHRGYAVVLFWVGLGHLLWGLDFLLGGSTRHSAAAWQAVFNVVPLGAWAVAHLLTTITVVAGVYRSMLVARVGLVASCGVLVGEAACFAWYGAHNDRTSFAFAIALLVIAGVSWRASVEPENPRA